MAIDNIPKTLQLDGLHEIPGGNKGSSR
jgi:hypothetical protein